MRPKWLCCQNFNFGVRCMGYNFVLQTGTTFVTLYLLSSTIPLFQNGINSYWKGLLIGEQMIPLRKEAKKKTVELLPLKEIEPIHVNPIALRAAKTLKFWLF